MPKVSIEDKIRKLHNQVSKLQNEITKESKKAFKQMTKDVFKKYPELQSFSWQQYTPYFNDGDTCTFSAYTDYLYINGSEESESLYEISSLIDDVKNKTKTISKLEKEMKNDSGWIVEHNKKKIEEINNANLGDLTKRYHMLSYIVDCLSLIGDDVLQDMFGDHVSVIVSRDGIVTAHHDHE